MDCLRCLTASGAEARTQTPPIGAAEANPSNPAHERGSTSEARNEPEAIVPQLQIKRPPVPVFIAATVIVRPKGADYQRCRLNTCCEVALLPRCT